ncbi:MAG: response regulator [Lentisphaeria bacterium]|nr:response regulator [Lentisphaeria bacterium]NQZ67594.1 response regulator [Lentisphaeria bacterium]
MNVLIVDDSLLIRKQLKLFFETELDYTVVAMGIDGNDAVSLYKEYKPDIMTLDLTMPNKDGCEALKEIINFDPDARVVICSAIKDAAKITETLIGGARSHIKKPLKLQDPEFIQLVKDDIEEALED